MTPADILLATATRFGLTPAQLQGKDRHKSITLARHCALYLCRSLTDMSFPELGREFGNRDHTTVMSACRRIGRLRETDPRVAEHLRAIVEMVSEEPRYRVEVA